MKTTLKNQNGIRQPSRSWHAMIFTMISAVLLAVGISSQAQQSPNADFVNGFDNATPGALNSISGWSYWYNGAGTLSLDTLTNNGGAGSLKVTIPFTLPYRAVDQGTWLGGFDNSSAFSSTIVYDGTQFSNIQFDVLMDVNDPHSPLGDYGYIGVGLEPQGTGGGAREAGNILIPSTASNTWFHVNIPVNRSATYHSTPGDEGVAFTYSTYDNGSYNSFLTNPVVMHLDNLRVKLGTFSNPPPTLSIKSISPGLNFVQGSISGQFDRQNIRNLSTTANYGFSGLATAINPVTYSFTITKWDAPDLTYHIFIDQVAGAGGASASDYNQPNVLIFQIGPNNGATSIPNTITAQLTWKTNSPNSGTTGTAFSKTNLPSSDLVGTWQVKFVSNTTGSIIPPDGTPLPFTIDSGLAANLANPVYVSFGLLPSANTNTLLGESVTVSQISITGGDSLSSTTPGVYTDNFLTDSSLDVTDKFSVNALFPASILFVPSNIVYQVGRTLPAPGFALQVNSNLGNAGSWSILSGLPTSILPPGIISLIPKSSLPAGNNAFFRLIKLTPTQLQVLMPGETNAPNTVTGKTGTPAPISGGDSGAIVAVTINAVDANFNIVANTDNVVLTSTDPNAIMPGQAGLVNGTLTENVDMDTGTWTITATDNSIPPLAPNTSTSFTVSP